MNEKEHILQVGDLVLYKMSWDTEYSIGRIMNINKHNIARIQSIKNVNAYSYLDCHKLQFVESIEIGELLNI